MASKGNNVPWAFVGGPLWLDFINTEIVEHGQARDLLQNIDDYQTWLRLAVARTGQSDVIVLPRGHQQANEKIVIAQIRQFRDALREFANTSLQGKEMPGKFLKEINQVLGSYVGFTQLRKREGAWVTEFVRADAASSLSSLLPIAQSLAEFATTADLSRLHHCGNPECILFFYDDTKNQARRFCSAATCGNRLRVAAHYRRQRELRSRKKTKEDERRRKKTKES